jgi:arginyl-tRNA synthetase
MADPQVILTERFQSALAKAFGSEFANTDPMIRRSDRADYQANVAMGLGKALKRAPRQVAEEILKTLDLSDVCGVVEIAGPGFINLSLKPEFLTRALREVASDPRLGIPFAKNAETVVIDYSAPNVAKEMHVGHLRTTIIGDALARTLEFAGHRVIRQNHIGDWGTPFGMLIEHLLDLGESEGAKELSVGQLNSFYKDARRKFDSDEGFAGRARQRVVLLQSGDAETLRLWKLLVDESKRYFSLVYAQLGVGLNEEHVRGESFYNPLLNDVANELESRGIAEYSDDALCVFLEGFVGREDKPLPIIVRKRDGGYGYAATDLAAIRFRIKDLAATRLLYVVGAPQEQHFSMVFATAKKAGWLTAPTRAEHVGFGSVLGTDNKMLKSREGESIRLIDLLNEAVERAEKSILEKNPSLPEEERKRVAKQVGIGAVKYVDLSSDRVKDYVFDWDRMLAFEGNTGPYLQYAHARVRSIFRKADGPLIESDKIEIREPAEKALALELLTFGTAVEQVDTLLMPHKLCTYLYELANKFMVFYESCPVLKNSTDAERTSRLALCDLTARTLARGLSLLGIEAPDRM